MEILLSPQCRIKTDTNPAFSCVIGHGMVFSLFVSARQNQATACGQPTNSDYACTLCLVYAVVLYSEPNFEQEIEGPYYQEFETILTHTTSMTNL